MIRLIYGTAIVGTLAAAATPQVAFGQTAPAVPNFGNYQSLDGAYRVGVNVTNQLNGFNAMQSFQQNTIEDITDYLDPSQISPVIGQQNAQFAAIQQVYDLRGALALAGYAQNSPVLTIRFVTPAGQTVNRADGTPCTFAFTGQTRQQAFNVLDTALDDDTSPITLGLQECLSRSFARFSPVDLLGGNPGSLQSSIARNALDLTSGDSVIEEESASEGVANTAGDPFIVGASYTTGGAGRFDIQRIDARIQRSFRVFEGNRAQLKIDLPFSYSRISGAKGYSAQLGVGLEVPVIARRWSLEPRVAFGAVYSGDSGTYGNVLQASVSSRYVLNGVGRGRLVIGNMIGYSTTLDPIGTQAKLNPDLKNVVLRNGLAYELPFKGRVGGRSVSMRGSYAFTKFFGSDLRNDNFHEVTLSFGLRGREESVRARRDLVRLNLSTTQARGYHTYTAGLGFRF